VKDLLAAAARRRLPRSSCGVVVGAGRLVALDMYFRYDYSSRHLAANI